MSRMKELIVKAEDAGIDPAQALSQAGWIGFSVRRELTAFEATLLEEIEATEEAFLRAEVGQLGDIT